MPPKGYRDESKRLKKSIDRYARELMRLCAKLGDEEGRQRYEKQLADSAEHEARRKAASGRERDLDALIRIAVSVNAGMNVWAAAGIVADAITPQRSPYRDTNQQRLYDKFRKAPALYRRLSSTSEDPADAADREICEMLGLTPRADLRRNEELKRAEHIRAYYAARDQQDRAALDASEEEDG